MLRRNIGCVFQDFKLLTDRTAFENVAYALKVQGQSKDQIRRKVPEILALVGLGSKMNSFPHELSGGEQQRVSIARAFVNHPPLLICDEPTGNLDPDTSVGIMQLLYRINRTGTTVVMATHDREMVDKMRKRVIALEEGIVVRDERRGGYGLLDGARKLFVRRGLQLDPGESLDERRGGHDRADRHVPARPLHRARHLGVLLDRTTSRRTSSSTSTSHREGEEAPPKEINARQRAARPIPGGEVLPVRLQGGRLGGDAGAVPGADRGDRFGTRCRRRSRSYPTTPTR